MVKQFIGTGQDQVPVNGMLGDLAFQSKESVKFNDGDGSLSALTLNPIYKQIAQSAVDVFVYDTRKDSDGGAWRKRCNHTSWYNETLNTNTRGSRREFPAVALVVASANSITIYDADTADLSMWMVFYDYVTVGLYTAIISSASNSISCVSCVNGLLAVGNSSPSGELCIVNFIQDNGWVIDSAVSKTFSQYPISYRNKAFYSGAWNGDAIRLAGSVINDVAMTVLPNAPIDAATGLPIPTIAVATPSGLSILNSNGTVANWTSSAHGKVSFYGNYMYVTHGGNGRVYVDPIPWTNVSYGSISSGVARHYRDSDNIGEGWLTDGNALFYRGPTSPATTIAPTNTGVAVASTYGLTQVAENASTPSLGMVAYATTKFNSGWMQGNIRACLLSDTTAGVATASTNLVTNGTFASNVTGWSGGGLTWDSTGARAKITGSSLYGGITQTISGLTAGKQYILKAKIDCSAVNTDVRIQFSGIGLLHSSGSTGAASGVSYIWDTVTATGDTHTLQIIPYGANYASTFYVDDVEMYEAEQDRSANKQGAQIFGSLVKTPVAAGADLVAYNGFSGSNYILQPYNNMFTFGTGDFAISAWFKTSLSGTYNEICDIAQAGSNDGRLEFLVQQSGALYLYGGTGSTQVTGGTVSANTWTHCTAVRRSGTVYLYLNGVLVGSGLSNNSFSNTNVKLYVGVNYNGGNSTATDQLTLLRISATAATAEQILKMYNDEKMLFQENAKCTLYGTSDAVTALAFDEDTQLLHAGTSSGRSVFNGLRRVDNTTTAVTASISASNGLVAEQ